MPNGRTARRGAKPALDGRFEVTPFIYDRPGSAFFVQITADGYRPSISRAIIPGEPEVVVDFELEKDRLREPNDRLERGTRPSRSTFSLTSGPSTSFIRERPDAIDKTHKKEKLCHLPLGRRPRTRMLRGGSIYAAPLVPWNGPLCAPAGFGPLAVLSLAVAGVLRADDEPTAKSSDADPASPEKSTSPHQSFKRYEIGEGPRSYWIFEPDEPKPEGRAPVVLFLHGWFAVNPGFYGGWIDHLVRDGKIVIFPRYQNDVFTPPQELLPNALAALRNALGVLANGEKHVHADLSRFTLIGHSAGGNLAAQIAAVAADPHAGLPLVRR